MEKSQYEFTIMIAKQNRKKKRMPGENAEDETINDPTKKFKIQYIFVL